ncbi:MAG: hypothetical protein ACR2LR_24540 [Hassallia sp.]
MVTSPVAKSTSRLYAWVETLYLLPEADSQMFTTTLDTTATPHRSTGRHSAQRFEGAQMNGDSQTPTHEWLDLATALLIHYSFDLSGYSASELVNRWQTQYPVNWLHLAVIEALYQGRYKAFSVQQLLTFWQRRGQAIFHFNMEFERLICSKFPESLTSLTSPFLSENKQNTPELPPTANSLTDNSATAASLNNGYSRHSNTQPIQVMSEEKPLLYQQTRESTETENVLPSSTTGVSKYSLGHQQTYALSRLLTETSSLNQQALCLPAANHPPIGQFTPEKSDRSELFTSKLKAMRIEKS